MLKIVEMIMGLFNGKKGGMGDMMKMKDQAADMMEQHGDKLDAVTDKIPGKADDELVDKVRSTLKK